jgi:hypothetical protein
MWIALFRAPVAAAVEPMPDRLATAGRQRAGAGQGGERGVASASPGVGERHDHLRCRDGANAAALGQPRRHLLHDGLQLSPVARQRPASRLDGTSQASNLAVPDGLFAAGLRCWAPPRHGYQDGIGQRRTSQIPLRVVPAQQQRTEPVDLGGGDHGELLTRTKQDPQRLAITIGAGRG